MTPYWLQKIDITCRKVLLESWLFWDEKNKAFSALQIWRFKSRPTCGFRLRKNDKRVDVVKLFDKTQEKNYIFVQYEFKSDRWVVVSHWSYKDFDFYALLAKYLFAKQLNSFE